MKKPVVLDFRVSAAEIVVSTLEGPVTAPIGAAILTGTKGEQWPIPAASFERTYDFDLASGKCSKKALEVDVEQMQEAFEVTVSWSPTKLTGKRGDYKVTYGPGDYGIVDAAVFAETYTVIEPHH